ncbi:MAG: HD domain-containing protein [Clostridia bacterium]|nr:HD domain-containing protein [Clostridia bacterium]
MRKVSTKYLREGMKLAKAIYSSRGGLVMPSGVKMQEAQIKRLRQAGVTEVYIDDPRVEDIEIVEPVSDITRIKAIRALREAFLAVRSGGVNPKIDTGFLAQVAKEIHDDVVHNNPRVANLIEIKSQDDYLFVHAINVAILSIIMARMGGYVSQSYDIALGALLKDLGMAKLDPELLDRPAKFSPDELAILKQHAEDSAGLFKGKSEVSAFAKVVIGQHHERVDGSGYPQGLKEGQIHPLAKIVAIADTYAAMISDRPHRPKHRPYEAIEYIMSSAGFEFDHNLVDVFTKCTVPYPVGTMVKLSDGEKGVVVNLGRGLASRPIVRLFFDQNGQELPVCDELNLSEPQHQTKLIVETLDE